MTGTTVQSKGKVFEDTVWYWRFGGLKQLFKYDLDQGSIRTIVSISRKNEDQFKSVLDHSEKVKYISVKVFFWYQHKLAYCVYSNRRIILYISKDTKTTVVVGINEAVASALLPSLRGINNKESEQHDIVENI